MWGKGGPIYSFIDGQDSHLIWQHNQGDSWNTYPENMALAELLVGDREPSQRLGFTAIITRSIRRMLIPSILTGICPSTA
jgi:hypothetical protein